MPPKLREKDAAIYLGLNRVTLRAMRLRGEKAGRAPIPYYRIGVVVYYDRKDLDFYIEKCRIGESQK